MADEPPIADTPRDAANGEKRAPRRQYIADRCDGRSKYDPDSRPPNRTCWVPPCVKWCPSCLEQNRGCEALGRAGCAGAGSESESESEAGRALSLRRRAMDLGLAANVLGLALTLAACGALSTRTVILANTSLSSGGTHPSRPSGGEGLWIGVGLRAAAVYIPAGLGGEPAFVGFNVVPFDRICELNELVGLDAVVDEESCDQCYDASAGLMTTLIVSVLTYFPTFATDVLRRYPNYDVNCQKFFGSFVNLFSMILSLYTWRGYATRCFRSFSEPDPAFAFSWRPGPGLICIAVATFLKLVDVAAHCAVPTPTITRDRNEQEEYERLR